MRILVTGGAGYIGSLLLGRLLRDGTKKVVAMDLIPRPERIPPHKNLAWITSDLSRSGWENAARQLGPYDAVVHLAFKIRNPYGKTKETETENLGMCRNVFEFAFKNKIPRLIYSSSVAAYGAKEENVGKLLKESAPLQEKLSPYGTQKRLVEEMLQVMIATMKPSTHTIVVRLNSVTGPVGQSIKSKFGLITFLKKVLPFVIEAHPAWARQFIHERDIEEVLVKLLGLRTTNGGLDIYNAAPASYLTAKDIALILGKKTLHVPQAAVRPIFWLAWHVTQGRIPTHPDSANGLIYPINVDGSRLHETGFRYRFRPDDALLGK